MLSFFHRLNNPHCPDCEHDKSCRSCEMLREILAEARFENKRLLNTILELTHPKVVEREPEINKTEPVRPNAIPWRIKQQMLESESRQAAQILRNKTDEMKSQKSAEEQTTEELEKELGINHAGQVS